MRDTHAHVPPLPQQRNVDKHTNIHPVNADESDADSVRERERYRGGKKTEKGRDAELVISPKAKTIIMP